MARGVEAENEGADYLGVGAIFPTTTKDSPLTSLPLSSSHDSCCSDWWNQRSKFGNGNGVAGVSLVSEIMLAEQITEKVQGLMRVTERMLEARK